MPGRNRGQQSSASRRRYRIGDLLLDDGTHQVHRGSQLIELPRLSYRLLLALAEVAPDVLSHDAIVEQVWQGRLVSPETITQRVKLLRQALGDDARNPRYVGLARGEGYGLLVDVEELERPTRAYRPAAGTSSHWRIALGASALIVAGTAAMMYLPRESGSTQSAAIRARAADQAHPNSIAVLPFDDLSPAQNLGYLGHGIADEVLHRLSQKPDLHVIARTSSFSLAGRDVTIREIGALLSVRHVLQGSVRHLDDGLRVTAQLIDAAAGRQVWSRAFDVGRDGAMDVQDAIAFELARLLDARLGPATDDRSAVRPDAHEQFLQAEFFFNRRGPGDVERAEAHYRRAVRIDPDFARAWVGLAGALYVRLGEGIGRLDEARAVAEQQDALQRALSLQPDLAEAHIRLATFYEQTGDRDRARWHHARAWELGPNNPLVLTVRAGRLLYRDLDESIRLQRRAVALNPLAVSYRLILTRALVLSRRLDEAEVEASRALTLTPGPDQLVMSEFAVIRLLQGHPRDAIELAKQIDDGPYRHAIVAMGHHVVGEHGASLEALERIERTDDVMAIVHSAEARRFMGDAGAVKTAIVKLSNIERETLGQRARIMDACGSLVLSPFLHDLFAGQELDPEVRKDLRTICEANQTRGTG